MIVHIEENRPGYFLILARDAASPEIVPPSCDVYGNETWINIVTCEYEGHVMMRREALPQMIEALQRLKVYLDQLHGTALPAGSPEGSKEGPQT